MHDKRSRSLESGIWSPECNLLEAPTLPPTYATRSRVWESEMEIEMEIDGSLRDVHAGREWNGIDIY